VFHSVWTHRLFSAAVSIVRSVHERGPSGARGSAPLLILSWRLCACAARTLHAVSCADAGALGEGRAPMRSARPGLSHTRRGPRSHARRGPGSHAHGEVRALTRSARPRLSRARRGPCSHALGEARAPTQRANRGAGGGD